LEIVRSETRAAGGVTDSERKRLAEYVELWEQRANRTSPTDLDVLRSSVRSLYQAANLGEPEVVLVSSPGALAFAGTIASAICARARDTHDKSLGQEPILPHQSERSAITNSIVAAIYAVTGHGLIEKAREELNIDAAEVTRQATYDQADLATANALDRATSDEIRWSFDTAEMTALRSKIRDAMRERFGNPRLTSKMSEALEGWGRKLFGALLVDSNDVECAMAELPNWWTRVADGNAGAYWDYCIAACRDVLGLRLPQHEKFAPWEACAINVCLRYMHPKFCIVTEFPKEIATGDRGEVISYKWEDGWQL
jgi:hypothetical protein